MPYNFGRKSRLGPCFAGLLLLVFALAGCGQDVKAEKAPVLTPLEGVSLDRVSAAAFSPGGDFLAMGSLQGVRVWETGKGRQLLFYPGGDGSEITGLSFGQDINSLAVITAGDRYVIELPPPEAWAAGGNDGGSEAGKSPGQNVLAAYTGNAFSLLADEGGSLVLIDSNSGGELFRFYCFEGDRGAWLSMDSRGYYDYSMEDGESPDDLLFLDAWGRKRSLSLFRELLFRPDKHADLVSGSLDRRIKSLEPPVLILAGEPALSADGSEAVLSFALSEKSGGVGRAVLYRRDAAGRELPDTVFQVPALEDLPAGKNRKGRGFTVTVPLEGRSGSIGLSVFNREGSVESERVWASCQTSALIPASFSKPVLHVFFSGGVSGAGKAAGKAAGPAAGPAALSDYLAIQAEGDIYSGVRIYSSGVELRAAGIPPDDVLLYFSALSPKISGTGDFVFNDGNTGADSGKFAFLETIPRLNSSKNIFFFSQANPSGPENPAEPGENAQAAFRRLAHWLGNSAIAVTPPGAPGGAPPGGDPDSSGMDAFDILMSRINTHGERYLLASELFPWPEPPGLFAKLPGEDFYVIDRYADKTLAASSAGGVRVSYTPGYYRFGLSASGSVNFSELNPVNYRNFDQRTMAAMGMEQYMILFLAGQRSYKDGQYDKAIAEYTRSIGLNERFANAYAARGNSYSRRGDFRRAIDDYNRALQIEGRYAEVYNYRGFAYAALNDLPRAIEDYTQALRYKKDYADAYFNRASAYGETREYDRAIGDYTRVIEMEPRNAAAYNSRGCAFYNKLDDERAIRDFNEAIRLASSNALYYYNRGNAWYSYGNYDKALSDLNQALKLSPAMTAAYRSRANVWQKLGEPDNAAEDLKH